MKQEDMPTSIQTAQVDMAALIKLQEERDLALAENARLKAAMDRYSEDEMLSVPLHYELMGVIEDIEHGNGFDDRCLQTLKRVMAQLQEKHQQDRRKP